MLVHQGIGCGIGKLWEEKVSSTELSFAVIQREIAVSNGVKLSREEFRLGKSGQISQWGECIDMSMGT